MPFRIVNAKIYSLMTTYNITFASGGLRRNETLLVAELYQDLGDWETVRERVLAENLFQMRSKASIRRVFQEIRGRLQTLTPAELNILLAGSPQDQDAVLWLALCKRSPFIRDFATEVLHEKFQRMEMELTYDDYDLFFYDKAEWHPELERVSESTHKKQRQNLFRIMREVGLISADNRILPALLSPELTEAIRSDDPALFVIYPIPDYEILSWTT